MRIAVICSAGGAAFFGAWDMARDSGLVLPRDTLVLTDRACGAEGAASRREIEAKRVENAKTSDWSREAAGHLGDFGPDAVLLFFTRLVGPEIFRQWPALNVHPSLLPAFAGFGALKAARAAGVRFVGATLHRADERADGGAILAQVASPLPESASLDLLSGISFVQKTYIALLAMELVATRRLNDPCSGARVTASAAPALSDPELITRMRTFIADDGRAILEP